MINLLLGAPGGGKSYEAVVYHVLPALAKGRKVITNLPLNIEAFAALDSTYPDLLEIRTRAQPVRGHWDPANPGGAFVLDHDAGPVPAPQGVRPFAHVWDYYTTWKHPEGFGPLFIIDECHLALPMIGTDKAVEEWYSLHRHFNCDVLLLTQSYGKISRAVRDLVQMVYRVRKAVALGRTTEYIRKVQDGLRGAEVGTAVRRYKPEFFKLYRSHTQGLAAAEFNAADVRPIWKHWSFIGAAVCLVALTAMLATGKVRPPWAYGLELEAKAQSKLPAQPSRAEAPQAVQASPLQDPSPPAPAQPSTASAQAATSLEPFAGRGVHLAGSLTMGKRRTWLFVISQNGQGVFRLDVDEMRQAGYVWEPLGDCVGILRHGTVARSVICDAPQVGVQVPVKSGA